MRSNKRDHILALITSAACLILALPNLAAAQCALPYQITNGQAADATQVMANYNALLNCLNAAPGGALNAIQYNGGNGSLGGLGPLTDGQIAIGATDGAPQASTLTAGPGVVITNAPGNITIAAPGANSASPFFDPLAIPLAKPSSSNFIVNNSTGNSGTLADMASRGVKLNIPSGTLFATTMEQPVLSSAAFTVTAFVYPVSYLTGNWFWGISIGDTSGKYVGFGFRNLTSAAYFTFAGLNGAITSNTTTGIVNAQNPVWLRVQLSGGNFIYSFSFDGENFNPAWTVSATSFLSSSLSTVGIIAENNATGKNLTLDILSWTNTTP